LRKVIVIATILALSILMARCNIHNKAATTKENIINQLEYGKPVQVTVAFDDNIYKVTDIAINTEEIGVTIGSVNRQVSPRPEKNGDIARNTPEGPEIIKDNGGKLFEIKGKEIKEQIAIELSDGMYRRCENIGDLKQATSK
jgi:hypothetical protein